MVYILTQWIGSKITQSLLQGVVQGITEFLPVSSTAHLNLLRRYSNQQPDLRVDTALHIGSLLATLFWVRQHQKQIPLKEPAFWYKTAGATLPAGLLGLLLEKRLNKWRTPATTAKMLSLGGLGLLLTRHNGTRNLQDLSYGRAGCIGAAQALSLFPGLSRSGITQMAGEWNGLSPASAQQFSFVLAVPIVSASALYEARHLSKSEAIKLTPGILSSGLSSAFMLRHAHRFATPHWQKALGIYRIALGLYLLYEARSEQKSR